MKSMQSIIVLVLALVLTGVLGCSNSRENGDNQSAPLASATVTAGFDSGSAASSATLVGTVADVASITVDVKNGAAFLAQGTAMTYSNGAWSITIGNLPIGTQLTFIAHAYNSSSVEIFTGTTAQAMIGTNDQIAISMAPVTSGATLLFPRIVQIVRPAEIAASDVVSISVSVQGSSGETLSYAVSAAVDGGVFGPTSGSLTLNGTTGTIVLGYAAPVSAGTFIHSLTLTNSQGNSVSTEFDTTIITQTAGGAITVQFNPVVTAISAERSGSNVTFTASVNDDGPAGELRYLWSSTTGVSFANTTANPAVLQGYSESVTGNVTLTVTDQNGTGGSTTVTYLISAGQFPDTVVVDTPADPPAGQTVLASGINTPQGFGIDATNVYWTEKGTGSLKKAPLSGGAAVTIATGLTATISDLEVGATSVFVADASSIKRTPISGGTGTFAGNGYGPNMTIDATYVYYRSGCRLDKMGVNGGTSTGVVSSLGMTADMVNDATNVYIVEDGVRILKILKSSGTYTNLVTSGVTGQSKLATDGVSLYWTDQGSDTVKKISVNGGAVTTLASGLTNPDHIAVDAANVYWTESNGSIKKVAISGGTVTTLASGLSNLNGIAVNDTSVIWSEGTSNGSISSMPK